MTRTAPTYPGTTTAIEVGDWLVSSEGGPDYGEVIAVDGDEVSVSWHGSLTGTTVPASALRGVEIYTTHRAAREDYDARAVRADG